jgi:tetratricopeptide (TPR) repeat protein
MTRFHIAVLCVLAAGFIAGCARPGSSTAPVPAVLTTQVPVPTSPKLEILNQQIKANTNNAQAYSNRGYVLALLGRKDAARADLRRAALLKDDGPMHNRLGWAYFNMGDYIDAVREFETAAKLSNHRAHFDYYSLVLGYWGIGDTLRALENYQLAVERDPRFGEYKAMNDRTSEWTPLERRAIHETYVLWSKTWRP